MSRYGDNCEKHDLPYGDCIQCAWDQVAELESKLSRYEQAVEVEGEYTTTEVDGRVGVAIIPDSIPAVFSIGQRVRVLVMKEENNDWQ